MKRSSGVQNGSGEELEAKSFYSSPTQINDRNASIQDEKKESEEAKRIKETIAILEFFFHRNTLIQKNL